MQVARGTVGCWVGGVLGFGALDVRGGAWSEIIISSCFSSLSHYMSCHVVQFQRLEVQHFAHPKHGGIARKSA